MRIVDEIRINIISFSSSSAERRGHVCLIYFDEMTDINTHWPPDRAPHHHLTTKVV